MGQVLAPDERSGFEMILLRMVAFRPAAVIDETVHLQEVPAASPGTSEVAREGDARGKKLPRESVVPAPSVSAAVPVAVQPEPSGPRGRKSEAQAPQPARLEPGEEGAAGGADDAGAEVSPQGWHLLLEQLGLRGIVYNIASNCELRSIAGDRLQFVLDPANVSLYNSGHLEQIKKALERQLGRSLVVEIEPGELRAETPVQVQQRQARERQQSAVASLEADPVLRDLINRFDGELDRASIVPVDS